METLLVIALAGIVATLAVANLDALLDRRDRTSAAETLALAIEAGREAASETGASATLTVAPDTGALRVTASGTVRDIPFSEPAEVAFAMPADEADGKEIPLREIRFHPAGCMTPALVTIRVAGSRSRLRVEPFSGATTPAP